MVKFFWFLVTSAALWGGGQGLYVWISNPEPTVLSCSDYFDETHDAEWLKLTNCQLDTDSFGIVEGDEDDGYYIPVRAAGDTSANAAELVVLITDKKIMEKIENDPESEEFGNIELQGMVQFGIEKDDDLAGQFANVLNVVGDPIFIIRGEKPNVTLSSIMFGFGVLLGFGLLVSLVKKAKKT